MDYLSKTNKIKIHHDCALSLCVVLYEKKTTKWVTFLWTTQVKYFKRPSDNFHSKTHALYCWCAVAIENTIERQLWFNGLRIGAHWQGIFRHSCIQVHNVGNYVMISLSIPSWQVDVTQSGLLPNVYLKMVVLLNWSWREPYSKKDQILGEWFWSLGWVSITMTITMTWNFNYNVVTLKYITTAVSVGAGPYMTVVFSTSWCWEHLTSISLQPCMALLMTASK